MSTRELGRSGLNVSPSNVFGGIVDATSLAQLADLAAAAHLSLDANAVQLLNEASAA